MENQVQERPCLHVSVLGVVLESSEFCKTELENHRDRLLCEQDNSIIETLDWEH